MRMILIIRSGSADIGGLRMVLRIIPEPFQNGTNVPKVRFSALVYYRIPACPLLPLSSVSLLPFSSVSCITAFQRVL
jgi:hypothetical protein